MASIIDVEGIGKVYAQKLIDAGIKTTDALLEKGAKPGGRNSLAAATGIGPKMILDWVNRVDLLRIKGVGEEYADLLQVAGVSTIVELAQRVPANLHKKLEMANAGRKLVRNMPELKQVQDWIAQAKKMPRQIFY